MKAWESGDVRLLVIHQNFPGQFGRFVRDWAARPGWDVRALGRETAPGLPGFGRLVRYRLGRQPEPARQHPYLRPMEAATLHGQATARAMLQMRRSGFKPDVILAHPGWGETLYTKDVYPDARLVHLCEWYYTFEGADVGFDPEFPATFDDAARIRTWNALHALNLTHCDAAISPTRWQRSRHPAELQAKIEVAHEGIDLQALGPDADARIRLPSGVVLKAGDPVVTYVARNLEPYRGFHIFMRALEKLQRMHRQCQAVIVGGDDVSYGRRPKQAPSWREQMLSEVKVDGARTHFLGRVPHEQYRRILQVSAAHVYLTYPFVLSWSVLEAMASGCLVIGSRTAPVQEVLKDQENGVLTDFFDAQAVADAVMGALTGSGLHDLRLQARLDAVEQFDSCLGRRRYERVLGVG